MRVKHEWTVQVYGYPLASFPFPLPQKVHPHAHPPRNMQEMEYTDENGRRVIRRTLRNGGGQVHHVTGPAVEEWTVLPGGMHVLSDQAWYVWWAGLAWRCDSVRVKNGSTGILLLPFPMPTKGSHGDAGNGIHRRVRPPGDPQRVAQHGWLVASETWACTGPSFPAACMCLRAEAWFLNGKEHR